MWIPQPEIPTEVIMAFLSRLQGEPWSLAVVHLDRPRRRRDGVEASTRLRRCKSRRSGDRNTHLALRGFLAAQAIPPRGGPEAPRRTEGAVRGYREGSRTPARERAGGGIPPDGHVLRARGAAAEDARGRRKRDGPARVLRTAGPSGSEGERGPPVRRPRRRNGEGDARADPRRAGRRPEAQGDLPPRGRAGPPRRGRGPGALSRVRDGGGGRRRGNRTRPRKLGGDATAFRHPGRGPRRVLLLRPPGGLRGADEQDRQPEDPEIETEADDAQQAHRPDDEDLDQRESEPDERANHRQREEPSVRRPAGNDLDPPKGEHRHRQKREEAEEPHDRRGDRPHVGPRGLADRRAAPVTVQVAPRRPLRGVPVPREVRTVGRAERRQRRHDEEEVAAAEAAHVLTAPAPSRGRPGTSPRPPTPSPRA